MTSNQLLGADGKLLADKAKYNVVMSNEFANHKVIMSKDYTAAMLFYFTIAHIYNGDKDNEGDQDFTPISFSLNSINELLPEHLQVGTRAWRQVVDKAVKIYVKVDTKVYTIFKMVEFSQGEFTVILNELLKPFLLALNSNFTSVRFTELAKLGKSASRSLYLFIKSQHNACRRLVAINKDRLMGLTNTTLPKYAYAAIRELNASECDVRVHYDKWKGVLTWQCKSEI